VSGFEVHEVFLTREDVRMCGLPTKKAIHCVHNCVAVHPGLCHERAQFEEAGKILCAKVILDGDGLIKTNRWLQMMLLALPTIARREILWIQNVYTPLISQSLTTQ
jgi:hypothetical protein